MFRIPELMKSVECGTVRRTPRGFTLVQTPLAGGSLADPDELPGIKLRRDYLKRLTTLPDWRIACFFVDREYSWHGVAAAALDGTLIEIARLGCGKVESNPEETQGRKVSGSFLYNWTLAMVEVRGLR